MRKIKIEIERMELKGSSFFYMVCQTKIITIKDDAEIKKQILDAFVIEFIATVTKGCHLEFEPISFRFVLC